MRLRPGEALAPTTPRHHEDLAAATRDLPRGAYTTLRTVGRDRVLLLEGHLARMAESAALLNQRWPFEPAETRAALCGLLQILPWAGTEESRFRLTLEDGAAGPCLYLSAEPLAMPPPAQYRDGAAARTLAMTRSNARAKDSHFYDASSTARALISGRVAEVLMMNEEGRLLEGLSSNLFLVRGARLLTAFEGILPGQTRALVLEAAAAAGLQIVPGAPTVADLDDEVELFISSTSRALLPLVEVDGRPVGDGRPGPVTRSLAAAVAGLMQRDATPLCDADSHGGP